MLDPVDVVDVTCGWSCNHNIDFRIWLSLDNEVNSILKSLVRSGHEKFMITAFENDLSVDKIRSLNMVVDNLGISDKVIVEEALENPVGSGAVWDMALNHGNTSWSSHPNMLVLLFEL